MYFTKLLQVFSAFGFVHKIATFEKSAGFQVCIMVRVTWLSLRLVVCMVDPNPVVWWCGYSSQPSHWCTSLGQSRFCTNVVGNRGFSEQW